jgi:hypothetical protein
MDGWMDGGWRLQPIERARFDTPCIQSSSSSNQSLLPPPQKACFARHTAPPCSPPPAAPSPWRSLPHLPCPCPPPSSAPPPPRPAAPPPARWPADAGILCGCGRLADQSRHRRKERGIMGTGDMCRYGSLYSFLNLLPNKPHQPHNNPPFSNINLRQTAASVQPNPTQPNPTNQEPKAKPPSSNDSRSSRSGGDTCPSSCWYLVRSRAP